MYSDFYKRYVTILLLIIYIFNQADRAIFSFLMEPIKRELGLSDTQLGFLGGPALVVFYALLGIPIARLADRSSRVNIISVAVAVWSSIVALSATVATFWQFVMVRVGVGIGEAGFTAVAQSLISDYHDAKERARALSIFMLAIPLGGVVSSLAAGWINEMYGWRAVFIIAGLPGLLLAVLVKCSVKEPPRISGVVVATNDAERPSFRAVLSTLWHQRTLRHLAIAQGLVNVVFCCMNWFPVFFMRVHEMGSGELGTWFAAIVAVGGSAGVWLGGYLTSRLGATNGSAKARLMAAATVLIAPIGLLALWIADAQLALLLLLPFMLLLLFCYGPTFTFVQELSPANMRATMASVFILIQVVSGGVLGTQLLGIASDALTPALGNNVAALRWGMSLACPLAVWAAVHFWLAARAVARETALNVSDARAMA